MNLHSLLLAMAGALAVVWPGSSVPQDEYGLLARQIEQARTWNHSRLEREACRREALIHPTDRTPVDVAWRRTEALLHHLQVKANLSTQAAELERLRPDVEALQRKTDPTPQETRALFQRIASLRRQIAFRNPLLDFNAIVFLKHNKQARGYRHMVDQYLGFNAEKRGGVFVLEQPFGPNPKVRSLLANMPVKNGRLRGRTLENQGGFIGLDLDNDARTVLFAFTEAEHAIPADTSYADQYWQPHEIVRDRGAAHHYFRPESTYHVFKANVDGSGLWQLTDGMYNDFDPCFLPNGRIAFISERAGGQVRCGMRPLPSGTLHAMMPDGSDIIQLSWHDTQEWHPSVNHQGLLVYTRWDYVDRDSDVAHHLWHCYPDGRDPRSQHGNYPNQRELRPWMEMSIRAVPGSHRYVAVATPHHGQAYGSLVLIDVHQADDGSTRQLRRVTPEAHFPESESAPGVPHKTGKHEPAGEVFGTPWPLSEDFYLCVYAPGQTNYGIYLVDTFGNRELIYRDPEIACLDPIPLRARTRPPVLPTGTIQAQADRPDPAADLSHATVAVLNVYESEMPLPPGTTIKEIRVINIFPKDNPFQDDPNMGYAAQSLGRGVLGTAPVETDGSAHFTVPAGAPIYFQLVDQHGLGVQTMRSDTYLHPGEQLTCAGCHESKHAPPKTPSIQPLALRRAPSPLKPEAPGAYPLTFARLVQPVLDAQCLECHQKEQKAPSLRGDRFGKYGWSEAFHALRPLAWGRSGGNGVALKEPQYSIPGREGARASRLYQMLAKGHHDVKLSPTDLRRITLWLDCNSNFYAAYTDIERQARGEVVAPKWGMPKWNAKTPMLHQKSEARVPPPVQAEVTRLISLSKKALEP